MACSKDVLKELLKQKVASTDDAQAPFVGDAFMNSTFGFSPNSGQISAQRPNVAGGPSPAPSSINDLKRQLEELQRLTEEFTSMPTLYPTLKRLPNRQVLLLTLPVATPPRVVLELAANVPLHRLDDYTCEIPIASYDQVKRVLVGAFGHVEEEEEVRVDPNAPFEILVEYMGACRSQGTGQRMFGAGQMQVCSMCGGLGITTSSRLRGNFGAANCRPCNGTGRITTLTPTLEALASAWVDGGWNVKFPESVLRRFFPDKPLPFDGDFFKALLAAESLEKRYKQLARQFHPDLNRAKDAAAQFRKLREAFDALKDPVKRKRYEAGLKFQTQALTAPKAVVFRVPKTCGRVVVRGVWEEGASLPKWKRNKPSWRTYSDVDREERGPRQLMVSEILSWDDIYDERGRVMCATWAGGPTGHDDVQGWRQRGQERPFNVTWESTEDFVINV